MPNFPTVGDIARPQGYLEILRSNLFVLLCDALVSFHDADIGYSLAVEK